MAWHAKLSRAFHRRSRIKEAVVIFSIFDPEILTNIRSCLLVLITITISSSTKWDPITNTLMWDWHVRSSPDWSTLTREVTTDQPVAAIIPHGCSNLDYRGDNPEVEGSVPAEGPPTLQAGSHRVMFIALWRKWFTLCTDKWTKWVETKRKQSSHKIHCQDFIDFLQLPLPRVHCYKSCGTEERRLVKQVAETSRKRRRRSRTGLSDSV